MKKKNRLFLLSAVSTFTLEMAALTNHDGHKNTADPLLDHFLNLWFWALTHDSESVGVGDGSHSGGTQPGDPENGGNAPHGDQEEEIEMESRSFHHFPLRFAHNQPGNSQSKEQNEVLTQVIL